jgi:hypothetical protein
MWVVVWVGEPQGPCGVVGDVVVRGLCRVDGSEGAEQSRAG